MTSKKSQSIYQLYSKVSAAGKNKHRRITYYLMFTVIVLIGLLGLFFSNIHTKKTTSKPNVTNNPVEYREALEANMEKLASLDHKIFDPKTIEKPIHRSPKLSRKYLMRQNAPTKMYSASSAENHAIIKVGAAHSVLTDSSTYASFANNTSITQSVLAKRVPHPDFMILQGEFIHAVLETAIDSDLPGMLRAVTTRPVYSYTNDRLLIPKGSRLVGQYSSMTSHGINRIMVVWNRIILPNGISVQVDSPGTDALGRAGESADRIDSHFIGRFGQAALLSLIGAGVATAGVNDSTGANATQAYRMAISNSFQQSAQESLQDTKSIKPTLHVHQGALINVFVAHDLNFYEALHHRSN